MRKNLHETQKEYDARRPLLLRGHLQPSEVDEGQAQYEDVGDNTRDGKHEQQNALIAAVGSGMRLVEHEVVWQLVSANRKIGNDKGDSPRDNNAGNDLVCDLETSPYAEHAAVEEEQRELDSSKSGLLDEDHGKVHFLRCNGSGLCILRTDGLSACTLESIIELYARAGEDDEHAPRGEPVVATRLALCVMDTGPESQACEKQSHRREHSVHGDGDSRWIHSHDGGVWVVKRTTATNTSAMVKSNS